MSEKEDIKLILEDYYPYIDEFLGEIIEQRLKIPSYENGVLTSQLLKAARKVAECSEDEYLELEGSNLDSDLYRLEETLDYGKEYCEGFNLIFQNINLSRHKDADAEIIDICAQVKAFEFLSKLRFRNITKVKQEQGENLVDFTAHRLNENYANENYAIVVTRLYSAQYAEEHRVDHDTEYVTKLLKTDITNAINQKYTQVEEFCQRHIGTCKGIIFISCGRDYFGNKKHENKLYGLQPAKVNVVLNKEWRARKEGSESHKYLHHIVITTGRNVWKAIVYPSLN